MKRFVTDEERCSEPLEPVKIGVCHVCGEAIYAHERHAVAPDGRMIHCAREDDHGCLDTAWGELSAEEQAEILGYDIINQGGKTT